MKMKIDLQKIYGYFWNARNSMSNIKAYLDMKTGEIFCPHNCEEYHRYKCLFEDCIFLDKKTGETIDISNTDRYTPLFKIDPKEIQRDFIKENKLEEDFEDFKQRVSESFTCFLEEYGGYDAVYVYGDYFNNRINEVAIPWCKKTNIEYFDSDAK